MREELSAATGVDVWASAEWRNDVLAWADERLREAGIERTGEADQPHLKPWATVLELPTSTGSVWLKATGPGTAFEVGLYELLHRVAPDRALSPIAVDVDRGWLILPDGGPPLGDRVSGDALVDAFATILPRYGRLQRDLAPELERLLALGVADMRPEVMPARFDEARRAVAESIDELGDAADRAAHERLAGFRDTFVSWCERLAASPVPASIDHNDLHPWNMLVDDLDRVEEVRFYDWGDAVISHPFASMLVPIGWVQRRVEVPLDSAEVRRTRDAYLEPFADLAPRSELVTELELACRVGKVARALTWNRAVQASDPEEVDDFYAIAPLRTLHSVLDPSYVGGA